MNESRQYRDVSAKAIRERLIEGLASAKNKTNYHLGVLSKLFPSFVLNYESIFQIMVLFGEVEVR